MKLSDLIKPNEYISSDADTDMQILSVATAADEIKNSCLYILEKDCRISEIENSERKPAVILLSENAECNLNIPKIRVKNPRRLSALIHSRFYGIDYTRLKFIGITGTNGKTSSATMIYNILKDSGINVGFIGTGKLELFGEKLNEKNYSMTTPPPSLLYKTLGKMQKAGATHIVMEVSSHALSQDRVFPIPFEYAVFTNLSKEHLDFHRDMEEYYQTKKLLFHKAKKMILNIDDSYARRLEAEIDIPKKTVGVIFRGDSYAKEPLDKGFEGISYFYTAESFSFKAELSVSGIYNIYNSMLAAALCIDMGIAPCEVKKSLAATKSIPGRFEIIKSEITVIIDYAHTAEAFYQILKSISSNKGTSHLTVVFGCGGERDRQKRPQMAKIAEKFADKIIVTSDNARNEDPDAIINDIVKGFNKNNYEICVDRKEAIEKAVTEAEAEDIIAIIGKGCEEYNIDKGGYHPFLEKSIISEALKKR